MEGERGIKAQNVCNNGGERSQKRVEELLANGEEGGLNGAAGKSARLEPLPAPPVVPVSLAVQPAGTNPASQPTKPTVGVETRAAGSTGEGPAVEPVSTVPDR